MSRLFQLCLLVAVLTTSLVAQEKLDPADADKVTRMIESHARNTLKCSITTRQPLLDFGFRFEAAYLVECPFSDFDGRETDLATYARVTPKGGTPVVMGDVYRIPTAPPERLAKVDLRRLHLTVAMSGSFATGEGEYRVEILAADAHNRSCMKRWTMRARRSRGQRNLPMAIEAGMVTHVWPDPWPGPILHSGTSLRLTVLLHAAPMNPRGAKLRAWDRAFLLQSLSTLLQKMPCESVQVIAFNLDQEKEVYRRAQFDGSAFEELARALREMELGTVSYQALQRVPAPNTLLATLANEQLAAPDPSDAVIFLGPTMRADRKTPQSLLHPNKPGQPRFFYFEYFPVQGADFADSIENLTGTLHGSTFRIHSPAEFGKGMQKLLRQFPEAGNLQESMRSPAPMQAIPGTTGAGQVTTIRTSREGPQD